MTKLHLSSPRGALVLELSRIAGRLVLELHRERPCTTPAQASYTCEDLDHLSPSQPTVITGSPAGLVRDLGRGMKACWLALILATGCISEPSEPAVSPDPVVTPDAPLPRTTGVYASGYRVPVSDPALVAAAAFAVPHSEWTVVGDQVTLHYDLPVGLVGGLLDVTFTGTLEPGATSVELRSAQGTGTCVATATTLTCHEIFANLGALPISLAVVEQVAQAEYAGPAGDRTRVANGFASEPIGFVDLFLDQPVIDDNGGGGGGGGGNHGND